jgi:hypothetical protein
MGLVATISAACSGVVCSRPANASRLNPAMPADPKTHSSRPRPSVLSARRPSNSHSKAMNPAPANRYRMAVRWNGSTCGIAESATGNIAPQARAGIRLGPNFDETRSTVREGITMLR